MKFFFPDSHDMVDPEFDFLAERLSPTRIRQRDEVYAHELLKRPPYDGILVSLAIVGGKGKHRYTAALRNRLLHTGARRFFRLDMLPPSYEVETMGDSGAYAHAFDDEPACSTTDALDFYDMCDFDYGLAPDLVIPSTSRARGKVPPAWVARRNESLGMAETFLRDHRSRGSRFVPLGVAQGWDPATYAGSVRVLEKMGYTYIAIGGLAPLPTEDILPSLEAAAADRRSTTRFHLLGVSRKDQLKRLHAFGVVSFDSTMPLRQAFKDDKNNYHTLEKDFLAIRVPASNANAQLLRDVQQGRVAHSRVRGLERLALQALRRFDNGTTTMSETLDAVREYELLFNGRDHAAQYSELLEASPWKECSCNVCRQIGIEVVLFRGAERNKRRGYHNLHVFYQRVQASMLSV